MEYKVVSRSTLYESEEEPSDGEVYLPAFEFEEVEIPVQNDQNSAEKVQNSSFSAQKVSSEAENSQDEGFEFRLFAGPSPEVKISLRDDADDEKIVNERPQDYYFSHYSSTQEAQFAASAVDFTRAEFAGLVDFSALKNYFSGDFTISVVPETMNTKKVLDCTAYNAKIDLDQKRHRRRREGKKKRDVKVACRERRQQREKEAKRLQKEEKKRLYAGTSWKTKKKAKPKPKAAPAPAPSKPKYRTE